MSSTITYEIENYKVLLCSRHSAWKTSYKHGAVITLFKAGSAIASLRFQEAVGTRQDYYFGKPGEEFLTILFEMEDFDRVLSLLQTEKPLYVHLRKTYEELKGIHFGLGSLSTDREPVGEEEG